MRLTNICSIPTDTQHSSIPSSSHFFGTHAHASHSSSPASSAHANRPSPNQPSQVSDRKFFFLFFSASFALSLCSHGLPASSPSTNPSTPFSFRPQRTHQQRLLRPVGIGCKTFSCEARGSRQIERGRVKIKIGKRKEKKKRQD